MAEEANTARFKRDERRGLHLRIPASIAARLPEEGGNGTLWPHRR